MRSGVPAGTESPAPFKPFTLSQVALNDLIKVFAFAPIVGLLLGLPAITVPWETLLLSVALYIIVPVIIAQVMRRQVLASGGEATVRVQVQRALATVVGVLIEVPVMHVVRRGGLSSLSGAGPSAALADTRSGLK